MSIAKVAEKGVAPSCGKRMAWQETPPLRGTQD